MNKKLIALVLVGLLLTTAFTAMSKQIKNLEVKDCEQRELKNDDPWLEFNDWDITVDDDGGADYTKIQNAIDNSTNGDTIFVYNGLYVENININKSINLIGEEPQNRIIDGNFTEDVVNIIADCVTIEGFTLKNCGKNREYLKRVYDAMLIDPLQID